MKYDEQVLLKAANRFMDEAKRIVLVCTCRYVGAVVLVGFIAWLVVSGASPQQADQVVVATAIIASVAGMIGAIAGRRKAFWLRLQAQKLIALIVIARNVPPFDGEV